MTFDVSESEFRLRKRAPEGSGLSGSGWICWGLKNWNGVHGYVKRHDHTCVFCRSTVFGVLFGTRFGWQPPLFAWLRGKTIMRNKDSDSALNCH